MKRHTVLQLCGCGDSVRVSRRFFCGRGMVMGMKSKYPRQPWKGAGGAVRGRDIRRSDEKREREVVRGDVEKLFSLPHAKKFTA